MTSANFGSGTEDVALELLHLELVSRVAEQKGPAEREKALSDLELLGFNAGFRLIERLTRDHPKFKDELNLMKFVCKDFWTSVFHKQIDNLCTNHQGVYVMQDKNFKFLAKISSSASPSTSSSTTATTATTTSGSGSGSGGGKQYLEDAALFVVFACGLVRGALANLNLNSVVTAEVVSPPSVKFQVQVERH